MESKERCGSGSEKENTPPHSSVGEEREIKGLPLKKTLAEMELCGEKWFSIKVKP